MVQTVIRNVLLFDGKTSRKDSTVIFNSESGLIETVSDSSLSSSSYPSGATVIDGRDCTLLPGLIDAHIHSYGLHLPPGADVASILKGPLKCGVTTVCCMHSDSENVWDHEKRLRDEVDQARKDGETGRVTLSSLKSAHLGATIGTPERVSTLPLFALHSYEQSRSSFAATLL